MGFKGIARVDRGCVLGCDFILDFREGGEEGEQCRTNVRRRENGFNRGRQGKSYSGTGYKSNATSFGRNNASRYAKDKAMLAQPQEARNILDEEKLAFLVDPGALDDQAVQTIIPNNAAFQIEDLDTYDSDCDDVSNAKAVLMDNISNYGFDVISEVPHSKTYLNDMENQSVYAMQDFEQTPIVDVTDNEITSDSNIILYSQYLQETQQEIVQETNFRHNKIQ
uniref:Retrovirus-related Pol polyprotein from transposon TNT 1-94 n=1 Tax=Tanacetum cinerariifolium TaxID=118510 RepID=A0A699GJI1_TANCI|nr:hypothetical protein [Tanacetum cinerariifolium]